MITKRNKDKHVKHFLPRILLYGFPVVLSFGNRREVSWFLAEKISASLLQIYLFSERMANWWRSHFRHLFNISLYSVDNHELVPTLLLYVRCRSVSTNRIRFVGSYIVLGCRYYGYIRSPWQQCKARLAKKNISNLVQLKWFKIVKLFSSTTVFIRPFWGTGVYRLTLSVGMEV